jgi:hypothetical protein
MGQNLSVLQGTFTELTNITEITSVFMEMKHADRHDLNIMLKNLCANIA